MKLKRLPDDFRVEELADFPADGGSFALYVLEKRSLGTLEAIGAVARQWNLPRERISFGGLKDKHAVSRQFVTIQDGPQRDLRQANLDLVYRRQSPFPFEPRHIAGNRFEIVLRDLDAQQVAYAVEELGVLARVRVPNYFDGQRFGSVGASGQFMAWPWCRGDYERALWLALADPNPRDRPREQEAKQVLRERWGDWNACRAALGDSPLQKVVGFLAHNPRNFRTAITYLPQDLRSLYLAAFQSHLWNRMLASYLAGLLGSEHLWPADVGGDSIPFYRSPSKEQLEILASATLPLPSARLHLDDGPVKSLVNAVLCEQGLELRELRVKYPRDSFFSKGDRAVTFVPQNLRHKVSEDEVYPGRQALRLNFDLPRGSYATVLVKRITIKPESK